MLDSIKRRIHRWWNTRDVEYTIRQFRTHQGEGRVFTKVTTTKF